MYKLLKIIVQKTTQWGRKRWSCLLIESYANKLEMIWTRLKGIVRWFTVCLSGWGRYWWVRVIHLCRYMQTLGISSKIREAWCTYWSLCLRPITLYLPYPSRRNTDLGYPVEALKSTAHGLSELLYCIGLCHHSPSPDNVRCRINWRYKYILLKICFILPACTVFFQVTHLTFYGLFSISEWANH